MMFSGCEEQDSVRCETSSRSSVQHPGTHLQVSVGNAHSVKLLQRYEHLPQNTSRLILCMRYAGKHQYIFTPTESPTPPTRPPHGTFQPISWQSIQFFVQVATFDELHDDVHGAILLIVIVKRHNARLCCADNVSVAQGSNHSDAPYHVLDALQNLKLPLKDFCKLGVKRKPVQRSRVCLRYNGATHSTQTRKSWREQQL